MVLCWQSNVSAFEYAIQVGHNFPSKEQASFNFMAAVILEPKKIKSDTVSLSVSHGLAKLGKQCFKTLDSLKTSCSFLIGG